MKRRRFLGALAGVSAVGLAGCVDDEPDFISNYSFEIGEELDFLHQKDEHSNDEIEIGLRDIRQDEAKFSVRYNLGGFKEGIYAAGTEFWMETGDEVEITELLAENPSIGWGVAESQVDEIDISEELENSEDQYMSLEQISDGSTYTGFEPAIYPTEDKHYEE